MTIALMTVQYCDLRVLMMLPLSTHGHVLIWLARVYRPHRTELQQLIRQSQYERAIRLNLCEQLCAVFDCTYHKHTQTWPQRQTLTHICELEAHSSIMIAASIVHICVDRVTSVSLSMSLLPYALVLMLQPSVTAIGVTSVTING